MALRTFTLSSASPTVLQNALANALHEVKSSAGLKTILYSLAPAPALSSSHLSSLVSQLTDLPSSVGTLSSVVSNSAETVETTVSLAVFPATHASPFRSTLPGREKTVVGKWHAARHRSPKGPTASDSVLEAELLNEQTNWENVWARRSGGELPAGLRELESRNVHTILSLSDSAPEGLSSALGHFQHANKLTLLTTSTPFLTGRPHTLFFGRDVFSDGAVGIALYDTNSGQPRNSKDLHVNFSGLTPITQKLTVTAVEGNIVLELSNKNPSRLILQAIASAGLDASFRADDIKQDEFYLGVLRNGKVSQLYNIMSGDPSRGAIALESDAAPDEGCIVQVFHLPQTLHAAHITPTPGLNFIITPQQQFVSSDEVAQEHRLSEELNALNSTFLASSENGLVISRVLRRGLEQPWKCTVRGGHVNLNSL